MYRAFAIHASDQGGAIKFNNVPLIKEIVALRHEITHILGCDNYAMPNYR